MPPETVAALLTSPPPAIPGSPQMDLLLPHPRTSPARHASERLTAHRRAARRRPDGRPDRQEQIVEWYCDWSASWTARRPGGSAWPRGAALDPALPATPPPGLFALRDGDSVTTARLNAEASRSASLPERDSRNDI